MEHPVTLAKTIPPLPHHPARPDRPVGVHYATGSPGGAGRIDHKGGPLGITHGKHTWCTIRHLPQFVRGEHSNILFRTGNAIRSNAESRLHRKGERGYFRHGQPNGHCDGDQTRRNSSKKGKWKFDSITQPQQHPCSGRKSQRRKTTTHTQHCAFQPRIAPALRTCRPDYLQCNLVGHGIGLPQHIGSKIEGRGAGVRPGSFD